MKKLISLTFVLLFALSMIPGRVEAKVKMNRSWYSRCPKGCQWDTSLNCGSMGVSPCNTGNSCGNCNQA